MRSLDKLFNLLDPSGDNTKHYHEKLDKLSDKKFDEWIDWLSEDQNNFYLNIMFANKQNFPYVILGNAFMRTLNGIIFDD